MVEVLTLVRSWVVLRSFVRSTSFLLKVVTIVLTVLQVLSKRSKQTMEIKSNDPMYKFVSWT